MAIYNGSEVVMSVKSDSYNALTDKPTINGVVLSGEHTLKEMGLIDFIYPVGSLYFSSLNNSPANFIGGEWQRIKDKFILAAGTYEAGETGGAAEVALTVEQMPKHKHTQAGMSYGDGTTVGNQWTANSSTVITHIYETDEAGGNQPHNNMPPYVVYYCWERTA